MVSNKQELTSELTKARQQLAKANNHVVHLEAQLHALESTTIPSAISEMGHDQPIHSLLSADTSHQGKNMEEMRFFLQSTLDAFPANTAVLDQEGNIISVNLPWKRFAEENGARSKNHFIGENYLKVCDAAVGHKSKEAAFVANGIRAVIAGDKDNFYIEYPCHSHTQKRWFGLRITPFDETVPRRVVLTHIIITERKIAEDALRQSHKLLEQRIDERTTDLKSAKKRLEALLNNTADGIILLDTDLSIRQTNNAFNTLFLCQPDEYFGRSLMDLQQKEDVSEIKNIVHEVLHERKGKRIDFCALRKDRTTFDAELSLGMVKDDGLVCTVRDITERKAQERQLRYHASLQENVSDAVIVTDIDFRIQSWNQAAERIYGWSAPDVIGKVAYEVLSSIFIPSDDLERNKKYLLEHGLWQGELIHRDKPGNLHNILESLTVIHDQNKTPLGIIAINHDITEQKTQERQLRYHASLQENVSDSVIVTDMEFRIQSWNKAAERIYGWRAEEVIGKVSAEILGTQLTAEDRDRSIHQLREQGWWQGEVIQRHKDGHAVHILGSVTLIKDENGIPFSVISVNHDISEIKVAQDNLQKSSMEIRHLYNNAPCGYHSINKDGLIVQINDAELRWLGYDRTEIVGKVKITDLFTQASITIFREQFPQFMERGWVNGLELEMMRKDGIIIPIILNSTAVYDSTGQFLNSNSTIFDITELKKAEVALTESEARYRLLAENVTDVISRMDARGIRTFVTPSCFILLGYKPEELTGVSGFEIVHPDDLPKTSDTMMQAINASKTSFTFEQRVRHKTGYYVWVEVASTIVRNPQDGNVQEIIAVIRDIRERKRTEEILRESEARYRLLAENVIDVIVRMNPDGTRTFVSTSCYALLGYTPEELIGVTGLDIVHPDDVQKTNTSVMQAIASNKLYFSIIQRVRHKLGHYLWVEATNSILRDPDSGSVTGFIGVFRDITEQKRSEEVLQQSEARYRLLAENLADVIMTFSIDRQITYMSPSCKKLLGYSPEEVEGKSQSEFIHPQDFQSVVERTRQAVIAEEHSYTNQFRIRHKAGHYIWYEVRTRLVLKPDTGKVSEFVSVLRDITERKQAEKALYESEQKFRLLLDAAPIATVISDPNGRIVLINEQAGNLFGYKRAELIGKLIEVLVPEYAQHTHVDHRMTYIESPRVREMGHGIELFAKRKDASAFPVEIELSYIETNDGIMVMSFVVDITERKRIAAELESQRLFLRQVIDVSPNLIFVKDYDSRFVLANTMVAKLYNLPTAALIGKTIADFNHTPEEIDSILNADRQVITSGEALHIEERVTNYAGEARWFQTTKVPITGVDGQNKYVLGVATDISERKQNEAALKESESKYRSLIETMQGGMVIFDMNYRITYVNDRFCELLGYSRAEAIGKTPADFIDEAYLPQLQMEMGRRQQAESTSYEIVARHKSGMPVHLLIAGSPLLDKHGQYVGSFAVATDITLQKQAEAKLTHALAKEKELGELKSRFVSMASHEFRTPLATIHAMTDTIRAYRHKLPDEEIEERLIKIQSQIGYLTAIMNDVLLLARMQARRVEFTPTKLNLDSLCMSVLDEFQSRPDINQKLIYNCDSQLREVILDKKLMRQIINNLISNAIKYSPPESVITIKLETDSNAVVLTVQDQGIGIPENDLQHLFEPFHRAGNVGAISGTGLGLVIIKESVELHNGTISVESQVSIGTTFKVIIPLIQERI